MKESKWKKKKRVKINKRMKWNGMYWNKNK